MSDFIIRPYQKGDEIAINDSFNNVFGMNRSIEEWNWKFQPENNGSRIMVAVDDNNEVTYHFRTVDNIGNEIFHFTYAHYQAI